MKFKFKSWGSERSSPPPASGTAADDGTNSNAAADRNSRFSWRSSSRSNSNSGKSPASANTSLTAPVHHGTAVSTNPPPPPSSATRNHPPLAKTDGTVKSVRDESAIVATPQLGMVESSNAEFRPQTPVVDTHDGGHTTVENPTVVPGNSSTSEFESTGMPSTSRETGSAEGSGCDSQQPSTGTLDLLVHGKVENVTRAGPGLARNPHSQTCDGNVESSPLLQSMPDPRGSMVSAKGPVSRTSDSTTLVPGLQRKSTARVQDNSILNTSRHLWESAFKCLSDTDREILQKHIHSLTPSNSFVVIDSLVQSVAERKTEIDRKRGGMLTFSWKGRVFNLAKVMDDIVAWADRFKAIGDNLVQYDPGHLTLPWAGARFLLQIMTEDRANMTAITLTIERVTNISTLSAIYIGMYLDNRILSPVCFNRLQATLIKLHENILSIIARAVRYLKHQGGLRVVRSLFEFDNFEEQLHDIDKSLQDLRDDVDIAEREIMNLNHQWQQDTYLRLKSLLNGLGNTMEKLERSAEALEKDMQDKKRNDLLTWISTCPYKRHHEDVLHGETILEGTGQWLFETDEFIDWIRKPESSVFWLNGEPGVGKSHLTYATLEWLQKSPGPSKILSFFYCSRRDNDHTRSNPEAIVRALLKAVLMESNVDPELISLESRHKQRNNRGDLNLREAHEYLRSLLQQPDCHGTLIFIDALDEVDKRDRMNIMAVIGDIVATTKTKVWVASRPEIDIQRGLVLQLPKKIKRDDIVKDMAITKRNKEEIARYIEREIDDKIETGELLDGDVDEETRELILMKLQEKGDGMYLWVHLQIVSLCNLTHVSYVRQQLEELPQGLEDTYRVIYDQIITTPNIADRGNAVNALKWLCVSTPLKFSELSELVKHTNSTNKLNAPVIMDTNYLRKLCHNLITIDTLQQEVRLVHLSVREFLEDQLEFATVDLPHEMAVKTCINHLISMPEPSSLMPYIVQNWARHYRQAMDSGRKVQEIATLTVKFLREAHTKWLLAVVDEDLNPNLDVLFTIARYNLHELCQEIFSNLGYFNFNPEKRTTLGQTPLHLAIKFGYEEAVKSLLAAPEGLVDVNARDHDGRTPLALAVIHRNQTLIELLVRCSSVDPNIADTVGNFTPFLRAAWLGDENTMRLLLSINSPDVPGLSRLDLDAADSAGRTAFHWAIMHQESGIVRLLVEAGANVNVQDRISRETPLAAWAAIHCRLRRTYIRIDPNEGFRLSSVKRTIEKGLDSLRELCSHPGLDANFRLEDTVPAYGYLIATHDIESGPEETAELAPQRNYVRTINIDALKIIFATRSFDINTSFVGSPNDMPLIHSVLDDELKDILTIVLDHKSLNPALRLNVNIIAHIPFPRPPLAAAVANGSLETIKLLLDPKYGVDPRVPDWQGKTPLQHAITQRSWTITKMLIRAEGFRDGDEVLDKIVAENEERLIETAEQGHSAVLEFCGMPSNVDGHSEDSKLYQGSIHEYREAHLRIKNIYHTALRAAADPEAQRELLTLDVNFRDAKGFSTLNYAVMHDLCSWNTTPGERIMVVKSLLTVPGIELNEKNSWGAPLLYMATYDDVPIEIFKTLFEADTIDVNLGEEQDFSPLVGATVNGGARKDIWGLMIHDLRVHLNVKCRDGVSILGRAAQTKNGTKLLRALLATGRVDPNIKSTTTGRSPLSEAVTNSVHASVKMLLNFPGVEVDFADLSWDTPLTLAARAGDPKIFKALLKKKPNLGWKNYRGLDAMGIAVEEGHVKIVELLNDAMDDDPDVFGNDISDLEDISDDDE